MSEEPERAEVEQGHRRDRLQISPSLGPENSLSYWWKSVHPLRVVWNTAFIYLARFAPSLKLRRFLLRRTGMRVGPAVSVGLAAVFDIFFPEEIEIGANSIIGFSTVVLAHEYMVHEWRRGPVRIGANVSIGANVTILPGVIIGDGATVSAMSLVNRDIPSGEFWGGVPVRRLRGRDDGVME